jgi:hypothetical protein
VKRLKNAASLPTVGTNAQLTGVIDAMTSSEITLATSELSLTIVVDEDPCLGPGGIAWDAAIVLAQAVLELATEQGGKLTGLSALELGAGVGLPGLTFAALGGQCTLTDKPIFVDIQRRNAERNGLAVGSEGCAVKVVPFLFGGARKKLGKRRSYDYVLCSDILGCGDAGAYPELVRAPVTPFDCDNQFIPNVCCSNTLYADKVTRPALRRPHQDLDDVSGKSGV